MASRESSVASSADFYESEATRETPADAMLHGALAGKRKAEDAAPAQDKKRKLDARPDVLSSELRPCARLPPAVWQHIFSFCSLADLGRLLQVNRSFHSYLTDVRNVSTFKSDSGRLRLSKSESLWASARNALSTKPPKPLPGLSELQMWQLAWARKCQFCNKSSSFTPGERIWQKGPGEAGVRIIWPFGIRACGLCLTQQCQTDMSLLFSSASALRPALPFALITKDHNYIAAYTLQTATTPADIEIGKYYYKKHVQDITQELDDASSLGPAAAEEWSKGLDARGRERMRVAENWERWEVKYQWWEQHQQTKTAVSHNELPKSPVRRRPSPIIHAPVPATPTSQFVQARPPTGPPQVFTPHPVPTGSVQPSQRNIHDANEAKANRRLDIERRCLQMDPPIPPNILRHMDSFKAALQISQPMNDDAWSVLQPRLLAQLPAAQQVEVEHVSRPALVHTRTADRRHHDVNTKEAKEVMDREWDESQRLVRDKLDAIADEFISRHWDHGKAVTYENSPKFAADLLVYVRRTFNTGAAIEDTAAQKAEQGSTDGADGRSLLVLDNMKWVYDNKIRPLTEQRKELFICSRFNECASSTKFYGFEGVIQHFGAKHTNAFSVGNVVVAWREAEWPETTPFHPDPISVKHSYHASSNSAGNGGYYGGYSRAGTSTPHMQTHLPQASPGPHHYGGHYAGPFAPPQAPPMAMPGHDYLHSYHGSVDSYSHPGMGPPVFGPPLGNHSYMPSPASLNLAIAPPPVMPPLGQGTSGPLPDDNDDAGHRTGLFDKEVSTVIELAQNIWKQTSGIKDMPTSLRIYVLLHRVVSKFHVEFNHGPNVNHFIDALSNHQIPKALKNASGLFCKTCQVESSHQPIGAHYQKPEGGKMYTVLNLFLHFRTLHLSSQRPGSSHGQPAAYLDWKEDMIELPDDRFISGLIHFPGMDDEKLLMIATVFPRLFSMPLPKIGVIGNHGVVSPASSGPKDAKYTSRITGMSGGKSGPSSPASPHAESPRPTLQARSKRTSSLEERTHPHQDSPPAERRQRHMTDSRYYMSRERADDDYPRQREYMDYAPSPRMLHSGPVYEEFSGRRTSFREHNRYYDPPSEEIIYTHSRDRSNTQGLNAYPRQVRYYDEEDRPAEYRYGRDHQSQEASPRRGQSAADRFLEEFVPGQDSADDTKQVPRPLPLNSEPDPSLRIEDGSRYTPLPTSVPSAEETGIQHQTLGAIHPVAPSTISNSSRHEDYHLQGRHVPMPGPSASSRRSGPQRRRDRPHDQRMPSRYHRYSSVARDDPYGRGPSISRSQSKRYEEQRRRIDQQETPQPNAESTYSRDQSVEQPLPEESFYHPTRHQSRDYVSVQDRLHPYSPPRYRYDDPRAPPVYVNEYGEPLQEYEIIRVRSDRRQSHVPYMSHQPSTRYESERYQYVPVAHDRPPAQRYNSRAGPEDYIYYEDRERLLPRRSVAEPEDDYEPSPPEIKVESTPASLLDGP
ncbi:hypothetical protein P153DRAFT_333863 [Dothidotthia symphoricarpi CBS 119687]|uniref:Uncharacterized protein n=1 Tax=Dothidotthia symphoricarpi CBS 119687 TaxID=1392245 RepID=A0A6A6APA0_9PLEO|nr:uncharacterized protein P153DRAFT_333863 [Dothidotthia symphoricarpi CBS 119687]KAF2133013.1 hypothetical protein P153DRAFT_333863 [Dothidotthia symphoricarpi CBS 119687]